MECNKQCSYRTPYGYCSLTKCQTNLGTTYAEPSHFREEDMEGKIFTVEDAPMYVRPTRARPCVYITTKWIEDHKEQYSNIYLDGKPIIHCKDCKYGSIDAYDDSNVMPIWCEYCDDYRNETDFCSRGEKNGD